MKKLIVIVSVIAIIVVLAVILGPLYIVEEGRQAVVIRFGQIVNTVTEAGIYFKTPIVDGVRYYPAKIQSWDGDPRRVPTQENQFIWIDTSARWKIVDPTRFYSSVTTLEAAFSRLDDVIESSVRAVIAGNLLHEAVRSSNLINEISVTERTAIQSGIELTDATADEAIEDENVTLEFSRNSLEELATLVTSGDDQADVAKGRVTLSDEMFTSVSSVVPEFGIELIDIVIRQIRYSDDLTESVYDRMVSERNRIAQAYRSYGEGRKREIVGQIAREKDRVLSEAYRQAQVITGEADAEAAALYSNSYARSPDFFRFWRAVESYRDTLPTFNNSIITTDMDYFRYLHSEGGN